MTYTQVVEFESDTETDDSQEDPSFDLLEETRSRLSNISIKKKSRSRVPVELDEDADCIETPASEFDANEEKSFEMVQKIIEGCQVEKLKVDQCKLYLRKYGLRLTGKKDVLIHRIKEHISIKNGEGEHKYPASSFVMNCKGDACTGDVVMFEQNVYEMFNIASRSASGPPCGQRIVAGRIVKESYGAAKQQHTFTIEVLWSKGTKPLSPLHPLLIKGRNLYRLKTMRQRWEDESERHRILSEKHARGNVARTNREVRLHEKETKKALRESRALKGNIKNEKQENRRKVTPPPPIINSRTSIQKSGAPLMGMDHRHHETPHKENMNQNTLRGIDGPFKRSCQVEQNTGLHHSRLLQRHDSDPRYQPKSYSDYDHQYLPNSLRGIDGPLRRSFQVEQNTGLYHSRLLQRHDSDPRYQPKSNSDYDHQYLPNTLRGIDGPSRRSFQVEQNTGLYHSRFLQRRDCDPLYQPKSYNSEYAPRYLPKSDSDYDHRYLPKNYSVQQVHNNGYLPRPHLHEGKKQQLCRYHAQGGCHYGANCKYLH